MSERAWTKGPWNVEGDIIWNPEWNQIAVVTRYFDSEWTKANARLITAAPDLFEALDEAINHLAVWAATSGNEDAAAVLNKCTSALSKANPDDAKQGDGK